MPSSIRCNYSSWAHRWGGYESLATPLDCAAGRTATRRQPGGPTMRLHIGLEAVEDLTADLEGGFAAMAAATG